MNSVLSQLMPAIEDLCKRHGVAKLELFGSATGSDFDPERSDFDFIAVFEDTRPGTNYGIRFLDFIDELESVVGRSVDVLSNQPINNPYLARAVNESRQTIYESAHSQAAV
jgi:predicted nucleotidyltransferase